MKTNTSTDRTTVPYMNGAYRKLLLYPKTDVVDSRCTFSLNQIDGNFFSEFILSIRLVVLSEVDMPMTIHRKLCELSHEEVKKLYFCTFPENVMC